MSLPKKKFHFVTIIFYYFTILKLKIIVYGNIKEIMELKKNEKNEPFYCEKCDFICVFNSDWDRHLTTRKHLSRSQMEMSGNILGEKNECKIQCDKCSKIYKTNAGLWKHKQKCNNR